MHLWSQRILTNPTMAPTAAVAVAWVSSSRLDSSPSQGVPCYSGFSGWYTGWSCPSMIAEGHPTTPRQRWARVRPALAWRRPGLPKDWVRVIERHPEGLATLAGWCWLDMPGKLRHLPAHDLEFTDTPETGAFDG
jgi:hypothetical protein